MAEKLDHKELVTIEELAISSMWEMVAQGPPGIATPTGTAHCDELVLTFDERHVLRKWLQHSPAISHQATREPPTLR